MHGSDAVHSSARAPSWSSIVRAADGGVGREARADAPSARTGQDGVTGKLLTALLDELAADPGALDRLRQSLAICRRIRS